MECTECGKPLDTPAEQARRVCAICYLLHEVQAELRPPERPPDGSPPGPDGGGHEGPGGRGEERPDGGEA